jgi:hypothetical protein
VEIGNPHKWEPVGRLFSSWKAYAERLGEPPHSQKTFNELMRQRGFEYHRGAGGIRQFRGLLLAAKASWGSDR